MTKYFNAEKFLMYSSILLMLMDIRRLNFIYRSRPWYTVALAIFLHSCICIWNKTMKISGFSVIPSLREKMHVSFFIYTSFLHIHTKKTTFGRENKYFVSAIDCDQCMLLSWQCLYILKLVFENESVVFSLVISPWNANTVI